MTFTAFNTAPPTRITLLDATGAPAVRWTLQPVEREGRRLRWKPEGKLTEMGSATGFRRAWSHRGFRQELGLRWSYGLMSTRETWTAGAWGPAIERRTADAHSEILSWAAPLEVQVEPFLGVSQAPAFTARSFEEGPSLQDTKGVAHPRLELVLASTVLVSGVVLGQVLGWGLGPFSLLPWGD